MTTDKTHRQTPVRPAGSPTRRPPTAATLLALLDAHPGPVFTPGPLAAGLNVTTTAITTGLRRLQDNGLVVDLGTGRYQLAAGARTDGTETADDVVDPAQQQAQRAMVEWYLRRTAAASTILDPFARRISAVFDDLDPDHDLFDSTAAARAWTDADHTTVIAAQRLAWTRGWHELVYQFAEALWIPLRVTRQTADLAEVQRIGADAAACCGHLQEPVCRARQGFGESALGQHADALATCTVAIDRAEALADPWALAIAHSSRSWVARTARDIPTAQRDQQRALAIDTTRRVPYDLAHGHRRLGQLALDRAVDDPRRAHHHLAHAAKLFGTIGDQISRARTVIRMARARLRLKNSGTALTALEAIEGVLFDYEAPGYRGDLAVALAKVHTRLRNPAQARRYYCEAAEHYAATGPGAADALRLAQRSRDALGPSALAAHDRVRSEPTWARLCGVAPIPASSGMTNRHRLNRGGHRQANAALYRAVIVRMRFHQPTMAYVARRTTEGKTKAEIIRCLKRLLAREVWALLRPLRDLAITTVQAT